MAKIWRVIISIVLISVLLGAVFVLVGMITGGSADYVWNLFDARYHFSDMRGMSINELIQRAIDKLPFEIPFI